MPYSLFSSSSYPLLFFPTLPSHNTTSLWKKKCSYIHILLPMLVSSFDYLVVELHTFYILCMSVLSDKWFTDIFSHLHCFFTFFLKIYFIYVYESMWAYATHKWGQKRVLEIEVLKAVYVFSQIKFS